MSQMLNSSFILSPQKYIIISFILRELQDGKVISEERSESPPVINLFILKLIVPNITIVSGTL